MSITLARVDDRVIHGQTTTRWSRARNVEGIVVVGDKIANDPLRKKVLKAAAGNLKLGIYPMDVAVEKVKMGLASTKDLFLISDSPQNFAQLVKDGTDFGGVLNVGCMNTRAGAKVLGRTVCIDQADYDAFEYMEANGITIEFQLLPGDEIKSWKEMKAKYDALES